MEQITLFVDRNLRSTVSGIVSSVLHGVFSSLLMTVLLRSLAFRFLLPAMSTLEEGRGVVLGMS